MNHYTNDQIKSVSESLNISYYEEFDVLITGSRVIFSWNSVDISEIAWQLGEVEIDLKPCG